MNSICKHWVLKIKHYKSAAHKENNTQKPSPAVTVAGGADSIDMNVMRFCACPCYLTNSGTMAAVRGPEVDAGSIELWVNERQPRLLYVVLKLTEI